MEEFDLGNYFAEHFTGLQLDDGLLYSWPIGIRFAIGRESIPERPVCLFESTFSSEDPCMIISKDWPMLGLSSAEGSRYFSLFPLLDVSDSAFAPSPEHLKQVFDSVSSLPPRQKELLVNGQCNEGLDRYVLLWLELPSRAFRYDLVFRAIGNYDHGEFPSLSSEVYFLNRRTETILHMYDDRGLDVIAANKTSILSLYRSFGAWILDYDRDRIDAVFSAR